MKFINNFFIIILFASISFAQTFEGLSQPISLGFTFAAFIDTVHPTIRIDNPLPNIIPGKPIYTQDSSIVISGFVNDDKHYVKLFMNDISVVINDSSFKTKVKLLDGLNTIVMKAVDRNKNTTVKSINILSDKYADLDKPEINILIPGLSQRGINVTEREPNNVKPDLDSSKGLVRVQVFDDNKIHLVKVNNNKMLETFNSEFEFSFENKLPDTLKITAIDEFGNYSTKMKYLNPQETNPQLTEQIFTGAYYGLIIANQDYKDNKIPSLSNPIKDANKLKEVLIADYNFQEDNIYFLTNAGRHDIFTAFNSMRKMITNNDNLLIFYAGHGSFDGEMEQGFWLPSDATFDNESNWISNSDIRDRIRSINTKHTLLIADACFSGGIFQARSFYNVSPSIKQTYSTKSRKAITSGYLEFVPDKSVFLEYLVQRLIENADDYLTASTLYTMMKDAVTNNSQNNQTPIYGTILRAGDEGGYGDFVFIKKK